MSNARLCSRSRGKPCFPRAPLPEDVGNLPVPHPSTLMSRMTAHERRVLELRDVEVAYGGVAAVRGLSLAVAPGEIVGLIGPNGAGKSTTLHAIMGLVPPRAGDIVFGERSLRGRSPESIARSGIALVPEGRRLFAELTVEENLKLGLAGRSRADGRGG